MKILQVLPHFPPSPLNFGAGVVHVVYYVSKELVRRGYDVAICTSAFANGTESTRQIRGFSNPVIVDGIKVFYFPYLVGRRNFFLTPKLIPYLKKHVTAFDIAHLNDVRCFQSIAVHRYALKHRLPYVLQPHGSYLASFDENKLKWLLDCAFSRKVLKDASRLVALTSTEAEHYQKRGIPAKTIDIVGNGVDSSRYEQAQKRGRFKERFGIDNDDRIILYVGRMDSVKGLDLLIESFSDIKNRLRDAKLVLVGPDAGYTSALKQLINNLKIEDRVLFTGPVDEADKIDAYVDADVFVTPRFTGFPLTFLESCACRTPIVTTRNGDSIDWIDGNVGYVTNYDKTDLAKAIVRILSDEEIQEVFKANCARLVKDRFAWSQVVDRLEETYRRTLST